VGGGAVVGWGLWRIKTIRAAMGAEPRMGAVHMEVLYGPRLPRRAIIAAFPRAAATKAS
jgi:hypothetical protein